jgi:hypothetical protein
MNAGQGEEQDEQADGERDRAIGSSATELERFDKGRNRRFGRGWIPRGRDGNAIVAAGEPLVLLRDVR